MPEEIIDMRRAFSFLWQMGSDTRADERFHQTPKQFQQLCAKDISTFDGCPKMMHTFYL
jgi:hypothetical protein